MCQCWPIFSKAKVNNFSLWCGYKMQVILRLLPRRCPYFIIYKAFFKLYHKIILIYRNIWSVVKLFISKICHQKFFVEQFLLFTPLKQMFIWSECSVKCWVSAFIPSTYFHYIGNLVFSLSVCTLVQKIYILKNFFY